MARRTPTPSTADQSSGLMPAVEGPTTEQVYDERGNVRPLGTFGARPMTYAERVEIAQRVDNTVSTGDVPARTT